MSHIHEHDLDQIVLAKAKYLRSLVDRFDGSLRHALAAYHTGPQRVVEAVNEKGKNWEYGLPIETRQFFEAVVPSTK